MAGPHTAFFYGTLMHPAILRRVIKHDGADLEISPALLLEHTRHQAKYCDYPGMIPYAKTRELLKIEPPKPDLPPEERVVRGTLVKGLSDKDVQRLDRFEGSEYTREIVQAHPLEDFTPLSSSASDAHIVPQEPEPITADFLAKLPPAIPAQTYIWTNSLYWLEPPLWEFSEFVRKNAWKWVGASDAARDNEDYTGAEHTRVEGDDIVHTEIVATPDGAKAVVSEKEPVNQ